MKNDQHLRRFESLLERLDELPTQQSGVGHAFGNGVDDVWYASYQTVFTEREGRAWATDAEAALASVFPAGHPNVERFREAMSRPESRRIENVMETLIGIIHAATNQIRQGYLTSLIDDIRAGAEGELLTQAEDLVHRNFLAAAAVIAGGALETHLNHLVDKHGLSIGSGHGSISAFNQAIGQARKKGNVIYQSPDHDLVESWGKTRNAAAHKPGEFAQSKEQLVLMITGIRQFISRTT